MAQRICSYPVIQIGFLFLLFACTTTKESVQQYFPPSHQAFTYTGRFHKADSSHMLMGWSGSTIEFQYIGTYIDIHLENAIRGKHQEGNFYNIYINDSLTETIQIFDSLTVYRIGKELNSAQRQIKITKRTEAEVGVDAFRGISLVEGAKLLSIEPRDKRQFEFIGNSITCGYGIAEAMKCNFRPSTEDFTQTYAMATAKAFNASTIAIAYSGKGIFQNYDKTHTETLPAIYDRTYPQDPALLWEDSGWTPELVVLCIGTNDFAHEIPEKMVFTNAYSAFLQKIRKKYPQAYIILLNSPMLVNEPGQEKRNTELAYLKTIIETNLPDEKLYMVSLSQQGPLGFGCDFHPNISQHRLNANELIKAIEQITTWKSYE